MATLSSLSPSLHSHPRTLPSPSPSSSPSFLSLLPRRPKPFSSPRATANGAVRGGAAPAAAAAAAEFVPDSSSDVLTMFFKAEGTMDESNIPAVFKALEGTEGISDVVVRVADGVASVELTKQTTVQATGAASSLVEIIQGSGFKLQALNLSFEDEEDAAD
ncbi:uncharacterized protein LOC109712452 [Ananas comosus]|uniref:Uncharacterized protein LOC109712452 n=1 Tax=Ananas comosus TaxID=4615 RepID=A0A6P5FDW5_ANACO|nr:uncharacterized protein LOC109712452 [Ananas comosus]